MTKKRKLAFLLSLLMCAFIFDVFFLRPSGVYSFTEGEAYGFVIGMNKEQAFRRLLSKNNAVLSIRTREPFHAQNRSPKQNFEFIRELEISNYWVLYESSGFSYLLLFRNDELSRILGHSRRFGELETGLSMFSADYQLKSSTEVGEGLDIFAGMNSEQIDELVLQQKKWTRVFLNN